MDERNAIDLEVRDVSGQTTLRVRDVALDSSVGELIEGLLGKMQLPANSPDGTKLEYSLLLDRESRALHANERVRDALQPNDRLVLQPDINAG
jgi:hypothetical protein